MDQYGCDPDSPWAYNWPSSLSTLVETFDLLDIWGHNHPTERSYTWRRANGAQASRLDMFWISSTFVEHVSQVDIFPFFRSDHRYVVFLNLSFPSFPKRGPGLRKLNTSLLNDASVAQDVRDSWLSWQTEQPSFPSLAIWWEAGKTRLKNLLRQRSRDKASSRRDRVRSLESSLANLYVQEANGDDVSRLIKDVKEKLELEHLHAAEGARVRAREQLAEEGRLPLLIFSAKKRSVFVVV